MSNPRYGSGKTRFVGQAIEIDLTTVDPAAYEGTVVYSQGDLYFSNGSDWVIPQDEVEIARPRGLDPTTSLEQAQLRLSPFLSPTGRTQTGVIFEINLDGQPNFADGANITTRSFLNDSARRLYDVVYPDDGFQPGDVIWWRGRYTGTDDTQSQFSLPIAQNFPDLITTPTAETPQNAISGVVRLSQFDSAPIFGLEYFETQVEFYNVGDTPGVDTPVASRTVQAGDPVVGSVIEIPIPPLVSGNAYIWRGRYGGKQSPISPVVYSDWSQANPAAPAVFIGASAIILTMDIDLMVNRTAYLPINTLNNPLKPLNVFVEWGDGTSETFTTAGVKSHIYAGGFEPTDGLVTVTISGDMDWYGTSGAIDQSGLVRVENIGFQMGLESMRGAFRGTKDHLIYISPDIPDTVTSFYELFYESSCVANISNMNTSNIQDMGYLFYKSIGSGPNCANWDVSSVTNVYRAFADSQMNSPFSLGNWTSLTSMEQMFAQVGSNYFSGPNTPLFDQDIGYWDVSNITNMRLMFGGAMLGGNTSSTGAIFNNGGSDSIRDWDVRKVTNFEGMFGFSQFANTSITTPNCQFNQPIGDWDVSAATNMAGMFGLCRFFNQDLSAWDVSNVTNMSRMFEIFTYTNSTSQLVTTGFNHPGIAQWDMSNVRDTSYMFRDNGSFNQPLANWERVGSTMANVTNMQSMFNNCYFNQPIGNWNTSGCTDMSFMFSSAAGNGSTTRFNQDIGNWDVSNVTTMAYMFSAYSNGSSQVGSFNNGGSPSINNWDTSKVTNMSYMFSAGLANTSSQTHAFNQPIGGWDVSSVENMTAMFRARVHDFDQDISTWNLRTAGVLMASMFDTGSSFQTLSPANYSRFLTAMANKVADDNYGPYDVSFSGSALQYTSTVYAPGDRFDNAVSARTYLVANQSVLVSSASTSTADGVYLLNEIAGTYENSTTDWYFLLVAGEWVLFDNTDTSQATGTGATPWQVVTWTGVLAAASVLSNGGGWTISGDTEI